MIYRKDETSIQKMAELVSKFNVLSTLTKVNAIYRKSYDTNLSVIFL